MAEDDPPDTTTGTPALDDLFSTLADRHRRSVVQYFQHTPDDVATIDDLATFVLDPDAAVEESDRVALRLHHVALPTLERRGVVEYDPGSGLVRYHGVSRLERYLDLLAETA